MSDKEIKDKLEEIFRECEDPYEGGYYIHQAIDMILDLIKTKENSEHSRVETDKTK